MNSPLAAATIYWHLPILLVVVSLVYSATRHDRWRMILSEAARWGVRMAFFLGAIAIGLYNLHEFPEYGLWIDLILGLIVAAFFALYSYL